MAEAIDEGVALIVSVAEEEVRRDRAHCRDLGVELLCAIDVRIDDAVKIMADREWTGCGVAAGAGVRCRLERLGELRERGISLALV